MRSWKSFSSRVRFFRISWSLRWISTLMVVVLFTLPRPLQYGQSSYTAARTLSLWRWRVISIRPSCEMGRMWVLALSRRRPSRIRLMNLLAVAPGFHVNEVEHDESAHVAQAELPVISSAASRFTLRISAS